jgi:hypothetical protein
MVFFLVVIGPATRHLDAKLAIRTLEQARAGFETASWIAIGLLLASGIVNLLLRATSRTPSDASYAILLAIKFIVFGVMIAHHCLQVFKHAPEITRLTGQVEPISAEDWPEPLLSRWRRWFLLLKINAALAPIAVLLGLALKYS